MKNWNKQMAERLNSYLRAYPEARAKSGGQKAL